MITTVEQVQVAVWSVSAVFITDVILCYKHCRTRSSSSVIRVYSVYNKVMIYDYHCKTRSGAVWSGSAVFITEWSYVINTVEQDQVAVWSGSALFITKSWSMITTVLINIK